MAEEYQGLTPPPELVKKWLGEYFGTTVTGEISGAESALATSAARWGSDQELEACINYFHKYDTSWGEDSELIEGLRAARRPKPPSLKEQALEALARFSDEVWCEEVHADFDLIQRALEQLND